MYALTPSVSCDMLLTTFAGLGMSPLEVHSAIARTRGIVASGIFFMYEAVTSLPGNILCDSAILLSSSSCAHAITFTTKIRHVDP